MLRHSVFLYLFVTNVYGSVLSKDNLFKLDILHYNDFHTRFEETSLAHPICQSNDSKCLGGFARLYYEVKKLLSEKPDALLLNAGDTFQGTYWYTLLKWNVAQEFINMLPHDAHTLGNHDFDDGAEGLVPYLAALRAPIVVANMDISEEPAMEGMTVPSIVVERRGRKIGIIGLTTPDTAVLSSPGRIKFTDPFEAARGVAEFLNEKGVDIIIILSHLGLDVDKELAKRHGNLIDIIVGGHTHSLLWNGPSPSGEAVAGPYPVFVQPTSDDKHNVLIVQASSYTKYMGNLTVYFDSQGNYMKWEGGPVFLNRSIPENQEIKAKLEPYAKLVHEAENIVVGSTDRDMNSDDCEKGECVLGDILVDAMNEHGKHMVKSQYHYLAFMQRSNINLSLLKGNITAGMLFELLPYLDVIETFKLQGKYIREALERSVSDALNLQPLNEPYLLQVSGLRVTYNISQPEGSRISSVTIGHNKSTLSLDNSTFYQVTCPRFLATSDPGFKMFVQNKQDMEKIGRDREIVENYIRNHSPLDVKADGRIKIVY